MMPHSQWKGKVVIITGGSSGIGLSIAQIFAEVGVRLYLIARDKIKLDKAITLLHRRSGPSLSIVALTCDVSDNSAISQIINEIGNQEGRIDLLINNAGLMRCGRFEDISIADVEYTIQSNYLGAYFCTRAAWKYLTVAQGRVCFVSSVAGYIGLIGYAAYAPTKFAITGLAECLRMEGRKDGVSISIIYPGDTRTPLLEYEHQHALPETLEINKGIKIKEPGEVARVLIKGIESKKFEIYCDTESRLYRIFKCLLPNYFYRILDHTSQRGLKAGR